MYSHRILFLPCIAFGHLLRGRLRIEPSHPTLNSLDCALGACSSVHTPAQAHTPNKHTHTPKQETHLGFGVVVRLARRPREISSVAISQLNTGGARGSPHVLLCEAFHANVADAARLTAARPFLRWRRHACIWRSHHWPLCNKKSCTIYWASEEIDTSKKQKDNPEICVGLRVFQTCEKPSLEPNLFPL